MKQPIREVPPDHVPAPHKPWLIVLIALGTLLVFLWHVWQYESFPSL